MSDTKHVNGLPQGLQEQISHFREQCLVVLLKRLLRAKGKGSGEIIVPISEIEDNEGRTVTFDVDADRKRYVLRLE